MAQAMALQVKAEHEIASCKAAVAEAGQKLRIAQQESTEAAEAAWRREMADHEAAVRQEQEALQAEQVDCVESFRVSSTVLRLYLRVYYTCLKIPHRYCCPCCYASPQKMNSHCSDAKFLRPCA